MLNHSSTSRPEGLLLSGDPLCQIVAIRHTQIRDYKRHPQKRVVKRVLYTPARTYTHTFLILLLLIALVGPRIFLASWTLTASPYSSFRIVGRRLHMRNWKALGHVEQRDFTLNVQKRYLVRVTRKIQVINVDMSSAVFFQFCDIFGDEVWWQSEGSFSLLRD